jgi:predicted house-cleaning noncanonical NTP pyrophosphatase (MazG superfamily)
MAKLVRDLTPAAIPQEKLHLFRFTTLSELEYGEYLKKKLREEVEEYLETENVEELADIYEVLDSIIKLKQFHLDEIELMQNQKRMQRGSFEKRLLMENVSK